MNKINNPIRKLRKQLIDEDVVQRLLEKDTTLWTDQGISLALGERSIDWIDSLHRHYSMLSKLNSGQAKSFYLLGMGGASLSAKAYFSMLRWEYSVPFATIDCGVSSSKIQNLLKHSSLPDLHFVVASQSGRTTETLGMAYALFDAYQDANQFTVVTGPTQSPLREWAKTNKIKIYSSDPLVPGRFSALSTLNLIPLRVYGLELKKLQRILQYNLSLLQKGETPRTEFEESALEIAVWLAYATKTSNANLHIHTTEYYLPVAQWIEQLVAESLGKNGFGVLPITEAYLFEESEFNRCNIVVKISADFLEGVQLIRQTEIDQMENLAREFLLWQMAVSMAAYLIGIDPYNQPEVDQAKSRARSYLASDSSDQSVGRLSELVKQIVPQLQRTVAVDDYVAILAFLEPDEGIITVLSKIAESLSEMLGRAVVWNFGPQYLHSTGQYHKGCSRIGHFIFIEYDNMESKVSDSFSSYHLLQGDADYLQQLGHRVYRLTCKQNTVSDELNNILQALPKIPDTIQRYR